MEKLNLALLEENEAAAREAGFTKAADEIATRISRARKLTIAYEFYKYVKQEQVDAFNKKLKAKTERPATDNDRVKLANPTAFYRARVIADQLTFTPLAQYGGLPPAAVLAATKTAKERGCFDAFEVAEVNPVATEIKLPDPIVFGRVEGCADRFFIAEWGSDVSIKDLLKPHEG